MAARAKPLGLRADMVIEEAANETSRNNSRRNSVISSSSSSSGSDGDGNGEATNRDREQIYEPLATGTGARARAGGDASSEASPGSSADADDAAAPYKARRMPTTATNATAPDELAPNTEEEEEAIAPPKKSILERLGLDVPTLMLMFKWVFPLSL